MCVNASAAAAAVAWACEAKHEMLSVTFWDHMKMRTNEQTQGKEQVNTKRENRKRFTDIRSSEEKQTDVKTHNH